MGWTAQYFTTIIIEGNTPQTGIFIYNGTPSLGTLIGSWTATSGTDAFGNPYPAGINVTQGSIQGVSILNAIITATKITGSTINNNTLNGNQINQGQILETVIIFDQGGGMLFGYTSSTSTTTQTVNGVYNYTAPFTGTASVSVIGAGAGGDGGNTSEGGNGGGGGGFGGEPAYAINNAQVYSYTVGAGGNTNTTGGGHGQDGGDSFFDIAGQGVYASGGRGDGTGGVGLGNTFNFTGGQGGASNGNSGGASGGNSANISANGNAGIAPSGSTGAARPAAQTGSGQGGIGGNSGGNGGAGGSPGAGGGGAGMGSGGITTQSITYEANYTGSYYGPDATNGQPNKLRSTSTLYQGGETASGGSANGNQRCVMIWPIDRIGSDFAGYTMTNCQLKITNQHSWYNSGMTVEFDEGSNATDYATNGSAPSTWKGNQNFLATGTIAEGATHTYSLGAGPASDLAAQRTNMLGLGAFVAANHPYNLNYYGYFTGGHGTALEIILTGTIGSGTSTTSGKGSDGSVVITTASASTLGFALAPNAGTDANSNAFGAGYTGPVNVFDPNASPTAVEGWHNASLINGWANQGFSRYKLIGYKLMLLEIQINDASATSGTFMTMPTGYVASQSQFLVGAIFQNVAGVPTQNAFIAQVGTGAGANISVLTWAKQSKQFVGNFFISLD